MFSVCGHIVELFLSNIWSRLRQKLIRQLNQCLTLLFSLLLCAVGETGAGSGSLFVLSCLTGDSCSGSVFVVKEDVGFGDRGDPALGLFVGEILWADGQLCWFRHTEQRGLTGRQTCCPKPTRSQLISLHSSLRQSERGTSPAYFKPVFIDFWFSSVALYISQHIVRWRVPTDPDVLYVPRSDWVTLIFIDLFEHVNQVVRFSNELVMLLPG